MKVSGIMTTRPITVDDSASLGNEVALVERHRIKRLRVVDHRKLVGIVSRSNIMKALMSRSLHLPAFDTSDDALKRKVRRAIDKLTWAPGSLIEVRVIDAVAELRGVAEPHTSDAITVAAENVPGIKSVRNLLALVEPISGTIIEPNAAETHMHAS